MLGTTSADWDRILAWARSRFRSGGSFTIDGEPAPVPELFREIEELQVSAGPQWSLDLGGLTLYCQVHSGSRVEFDLDPAPLEGPGTTLLLAFLRELGVLLSHDVYVTPENSWNATILVYLHEPNRIIAVAAIDREEFEA